MDIDEIKKQLAAVQNMTGGLRAKAKPKVNKRTTLSRVPLTYRYDHAGKDKRGSNVFFCRATKTNAAGFLLCWKLVLRRNGTRVKNNIAAADSTRAAIALCKRRVTAWRAKNAPAPRTLEEQRRALDAVMPATPNKATD